MTENDNNNGNAILVLLFKDEVVKKRFMDEVFPQQMVNPEAVIDDAELPVLVNVEERR